MEPSEFTKKCQLAEDALREVLKDLDRDNEDVYWTLKYAVNILYNLAIPEGPLIGRSVLKCLLYEEEDCCNSLELGKEQIDWFSRWIRLFFDTMGEMGITRVNKEVYDTIRSISYGYADEEFIRTLLESDEAQKSDFKKHIKEIMEARPDYFKMGKPESEIVCDESCRGTEKIISRTLHEGEVTCTVTERPNNCLYKIE
jgi:hypothetical protein